MHTLFTLLTLTAAGPLPEMTHDWDSTAIELLDSVEGPNRLRRGAARLATAGKLLATSGSLVEGERKLEQSLQLYTHLVGRAHPRAAIVVAELAWVAARQYRSEDAVRLCREARSILGAPIGNRWRPWVYCSLELAAEARRRGQLAQSELQYRRALAVRPPAVRGARELLLHGWVRLAELQEELERLDAAEVSRRHVVDQLRRGSAAERPRLAAALFELGRVQLRRDNPATAGVSFEEALSVNEAVGGTAITPTIVLTGLAVARWMNDEPFRAAATLDRAVAELETSPELPPEHVATILETRAQVLDEVHRVVEAVLDRVRAAAILEDSAPAPHAELGGCDISAAGVCG